MKYYVFFVFSSIPTAFLSSNVVSLFFFMMFVCFYLIHEHNQHKPETAVFYSVPVSWLSCVFIMVHEIKAEFKILVIKPLFLWTVQMGNGPEVCSYYEKYEYVFGYEKISMQHHFNITLLKRKDCSRKLVTFCTHNHRNCQDSGNIYIKRINQ